MRAPPVLSLHEFASAPSVGPPAVVTIGNFDGVHVGHQQLLRQVRAAAARHSAVATALTFEPHPLSVLAPQRAPPRLTTAALRTVLLERTGADRVITLASVPELFELPADEFVNLLVRALRPAAFVEGTAFRFGRDRGGSIDTLREMGRAHGFEVLTIAPVTTTLPPSDGSSATAAEPTVVSSSAVRAALDNGDLPAARALLGRPHRIVGIVRPGDGRGRTLGFPTANLDRIREMTPALGVYAALAQTAAGVSHPAAVNIGPQPTFGQAGVRVEAHLLDFSGELTGQPLGLHLLQRLREQRRFAGAAELVQQIAQDAARARQVSDGQTPPEPLPL